MELNIKIRTYGDVGSDFFAQKISIRAYAKLKTGEYVYSDVKSLNVYAVANTLYQGRKMSNFSAHNSLYEKILYVVTPEYKKVDYNWSDIVTGRK